MSKAPTKIQDLLVQADERWGFPQGTMAAVMRQESGGQARFIDDPTAYHYGVNAEGRRIAPHTGQVSTAFGPFGILESTAAKPGYGVTPLKDKSVEEQVRFASEYLAARSKGKGLSAGLAGYGEGQKYAEQVVGRIPKTDVNAPHTVIAQQEGVGIPQQEIVAPVRIAQAPEVSDAWQRLQAVTSPVQAQDLDYGMPVVSAPEQRQVKLDTRIPQTNMVAFKGWTRKA